MIYTVWGAILICFAALLWLRHSRSAAVIFTLYTLIVVGLTVGCAGEMNILISNFAIAIGLSLVAVCRRKHRGTRITCVILTLLIPLYLTLNWLAGYRIIAMPPAETLRQEVVYEQAWFAGVFAMHEHTFKRYAGMQKRPWILRVAVNGVPAIECAEPLLQDRCREKSRYISRLMSEGS